MSKIAKSVERRIEQQRKLAVGVTVTLTPQVRKMVNGIHLRMERVMLQARLANLDAQIKRLRGIEDAPRGSYR